MNPPDTPSRTASLCLGCGYSLAGLANSSVCPECGLSVARSRTPIEFGHLDRRAAQRLLAGCRLLRRSLICVALLAPVCTIAGLIDVGRAEGIFVVVMTIALGIWTLGWIQLILIKAVSADDAHARGQGLDEVSRVVLLAAIACELASLMHLAVRFTQGPFSFTSPIETLFFPLSFVASGTAGVWRLLRIVRAGPPTPLHQSCSDLLSLSIVHAVLVTGVAAMAMLDFRTAGGFAVLVGIMAIGLAMHLFGVLGEVSRSVHKRLTVST